MTWSKIKLWTTNVLFVGATGAFLVLFLYFLYNIGNETDPTTSKDPPVYSITDPSTQS